MGWTFAANCHARVWKNNANLTTAPAGAPTYDSVAQIMTPALKSPSANPWRGRIAFPRGAFSLLSSDINAVGTRCWLALVDDQGGATLGFWLIVDMSYSFNPFPPGPSTWTVAAVFYDFILAPP